MRIGKDFPRDSIALKNTMYIWKYLYHGETKQRSCRKICQNISTILPGLWFASGRSDRLHLRRIYLRAKLPHGSLRRSTSRLHNPAPQCEATGMPHDMSLLQGSGAGTAQGTVKLPPVRFLSPKTLRNIQCLAVPADHPALYKSLFPPGELLRDICKSNSYQNSKGTDSCVPSFSSLAPQFSYLDTPQSSQRMNFRVPLGVEPGGIPRALSSQHEQSHKFNMRLHP